jgi:hypothetical protein
VWDKEKHVSVCNGPRHGQPFRQAIDDGLTNFVCEEFVDGVMINMFHDGAAWRLATRTQLDAKGSFYGQTPFATLFWDVFGACGLSICHLTPGVTYSWVLQHPEERIVAASPYGIPRLFLIRCISVVDGSPVDIPARFQPLRPAVYPALKSLEDVKEFVVSQGRRLGAQFQGVCMKTPGARYKLRTNEYDEARHLRGNQAKRPYLWLERWSEGRLPQYLRLYPEEACDAETVVNRFKDATQELHSLYLQVYRQKSLPLGQAPQKYRKLLWDLHQAGGGAYFPNARAFMNTQETARKLWVVNYEERFQVGSTDATAVVEPKTAEASTRTDAEASVTSQVETPA